MLPTLACLSILSAASSSAARPRVFETPRAGVEFLSEALRQSQWDSIYSQLKGRPDRETFQILAQQLKALDQATPLPSLVPAELRFPADRKTFSVGSHGETWNCLHIDFARGDAGWSLMGFTKCR